MSFWIDDPGPEPARQHLEALVDTIFQPIPENAGADLFWMRCVFGVAHRAREFLCAPSPVA